MKFSPLSALLALLAATAAWLAFECLLRALYYVSIGSTSVHEFRFWFFLVLALVFALSAIVLGGILVVRYLKKRRT